MQTSGMAPQFSDGVRKTITGVARPNPSPGAMKSVPMPKPKANTHRAGGHAKHAKGGR